MLSKIKSAIKSIADIEKKLLPEILLFLIPFTMSLLSILIAGYVPYSSLTRGISIFLMVLAVLSLFILTAYLEKRRNKC